MTSHDPARQAADYDSGAGWDRVADAMDRHGAAAVLADPGLVADPPPWCDCCYGGVGECECDERCPEPTPAPAVWPRRTHDGQRMRDTETADVDRGVL